MKSLLAICVTGLNWSCDPWWSTIPGEWLSPWSTSSWAWTSEVVAEIYLEPLFQCQSYGSTETTWNLPYTYASAVPSVSGPSVFLFFFLMLLFAVTATSVIIVGFCSLSTTTVFGRLASRCPSFWNSKSHRTFGLLFWTTFSGVSHQELGRSNPHVAQIFLYIATWLSLSVYVVPTSYVLLW